jgi:hypothetical protein
MTADPNRSDRGHFFGTVNKQPLEAGQTSGGLSGENGARCAGLNNFRDFLDGRDMILSRE